MSIVSQRWTTVPPVFKYKAQQCESIKEGPQDFYLKAVLLGDSGTGKTTLTNVFNCKACKTTYLWRPSSESIRMIEYQVSQYKVLFRFYDTAGQEKFRSLTSSYYRGAHSCLVLFDVTKESTFKNLIYWLYDLNEYSTHPEIATIIVGTKCHVTSEERQVTYERALKFAESVGLPYIEVSAEKGKHVSEVFEKLADIIIEKLTKDATPNMQQPNRVILSEPERSKKKLCLC